MKHSKYFPSLIVDNLVLQLTILKLDEHIELYFEKKKLGQYREKLRYFQTQIT